MSKRPNDIFSTTSLTVPNLVPLVARLRDDKLRRVITLMHVRSFEEGDWICATAVARLQRAPGRIVGPEPTRAVDLVEHAIRMNATYAFVGELRHTEDSRAVRAAASLGIKPVGYIIQETRKLAESILTILGPWNSYDMVLLSSYD